MIITLLQKQKMNSTLYLFYFRIHFIHPCYCWLRFNLIPKQLKPDITDCWAERLCKFCLRTPPQTVRLIESIFDWLLRHSQRHLKAWALSSGFLGTCCRVKFWCSETLCQCLDLRGRLSLQMARKTRTLCCR